MEDKFPFFVDGNVAQGRPSTFTQHLPWHDVAVVFKGGDYHILVRFDQGTHAESNGVDAVGNASRKNDFCGFAGTDVFTYLFTYRFHGIRRTLA